MTIEITGTFADGKHARVLHEGNRFKVKTVTASDEATDYPGAAANAGDTVDRWRPFANGLTDPSDLSGDDWTLTNMTVAADGQTLSETAASAVHEVSQSYTFTAADHVIGVKVERGTIPEFRLEATDGTSTRTAFFNLDTLTVGTELNATGAIVDLGGGVYECKMYCALSAGAGSVTIAFANGSETLNYGGDVDKSIRVLRVGVNESEATLRFDLFEAQAGDVMAIAAHNLFSGGARITVEHDSNEDDTWTTIDTIAPGNDGPILFFFDAITSVRWRIKVDRGVLPEVGVFRVGAALKFEQPFYSAFAVPRMNRNTDVTGNLSGSGELLGRSKKRTTLTASYQWPRLTYSWVRTNLDGPGGMIQSIETEPFFIAWRPSETEDVDYVMRASAQAPRSTGIVDLHSFGFAGEVHAYE